MTKTLPPLEQAKIKLQLSNSVLQAQIDMNQRLSNQERPPTHSGSESAPTSCYSTYSPQMTNSCLLYTSFNTVNYGSLIKKTLMGYKIIIVHLIVYKITK